MKQGSDRCALCPLVATVTAAKEINGLGGEGQQEIGASQARRPGPGRYIRIEETKLGDELAGNSDGFDGRDLWECWVSNRRRAENTSPEILPIIQSSS